ncbi:MAG: iron-siderophore ABC transporter substrate-binding protein [Chloroflexales bacterium]|nr:iron-siderophore ABC transporter substrate-binding protein [Chloroflexales bacterium]
MPSPKHVIVQHSAPTRMWVALALLMLFSVSACGRQVMFTAPEQLPDNPQRIIASNTIILDALAALNAPVVGMPTFSDRASVPPYLTLYTENIESIGTPGAPSLAMIAALEPDLIIIAEAQQSIQDVDQLADIASTIAVAGGTTYQDWKETLRQAAGVTGLADQAAELLTTWDARVANLRQQLSETPSGDVSVVRYFNNTARFLPGKSSFAGQILDEAGVLRPANQADGDGKPFINVSLERIPELDSDVIFVITVDQDLREKFEAQPLRSQLCGANWARVCSRSTLVVGERSRCACHTR